jgi:hypothetical protein
MRGSRTTRGPTSDHRPHTAHPVAPDSTRLSMTFWLPRPAHTAQGFPGLAKVCGRLHGAPRAGRRGRRRSWLRLSGPARCDWQLVTPASAGGRPTTIVSETLSLRLRGMRRPRSAGLSARSMTTASARGAGDRGARGEGRRNTPACNSHVFSCSFSEGRRPSTSHRDRTLPTQRSRARGAALPYSLKARELRRCRATRADGGPCQAWAIWGHPDGLCAAHAGVTAHPGSGGRSRPARPPLNSVHHARYPLCRCGAYWFPHRPGGGCCRWPDPPTERLIRCS